MHGLHNYNAQKVSTFAAEKYYTFSAWAQGDADAVADDSRAFLYIFNGNVPFKESNALTFKGFQGGTGGDFNNRGPTMTDVQSKANWKQISISYVAYPGAPEIGKPIGVGFYMNRDAALDDVTLDVDDAANHLLVLEVNTDERPGPLPQSNGRGGNDGLLRHQECKRCTELDDVDRHPAAKRCWLSGRQRLGKWLGKSGRK